MFQENVSLGSRLRYYRESCNITQYEMAEYAGLSRNYISNIERDVNKPSIQVIISYCNILNVSPNDLLGYDSELSTELINILKTLSIQETNKLIRIIKIMKESPR